VENKKECRKRKILPVGRDYERIRKLMNCMRKSDFVTVCYAVCLFIHE